MHSAAVSRGMRVAMPSAASALKIVLLAALLGVSSAAVVVNTHNGETFAYLKPHQTVPPSAKTASLATSENCICSDADPRSDDTLLVTYDCYHQALYGNCNATFMKDYLEELVQNDGYCQISCGRCKCCSAPWDVIQKTGSSRFLQAVAATNSSLEATLKRPGYTGTILVPSDAAFEAALAKYPGLLQDPAVLLQVLKFHILPPEPRTRGLWTSPFMAVGGTIFSLYDGTASIKSAKTALPAGLTAQGGVTGIKLTGPVNSATVVQSDLRACKTVVTTLDSLLWPFDPATRLSATADALSTLLGASGYALAPNAQINGTQVAAGDGNTQASVQACAASCAKASACNAWSYCPQMGGCRFPDGTTVNYGSCELLHSAEVAAGEGPAYGNSGFDEVPVISGWASQGVTPAAEKAPATNPVATAGR
ncbi:hypothetical protein ACKKBG_A37315 [Auxenochlorella protothecoides x Auxenochlorella symbiontica]